MGSKHRENNGDGSGSGHDLPHLDYIVGMMSHDGRMVGQRQCGWARGLLPLRFSQPVVATVSPPAVGLYSPVPWPQNTAEHV